MKSCLSLSFVLLVLTVVMLTCGTLYYLSRTAEFTRKDKAASQPASLPTRSAPAAPAQ